MSASKDEKNKNVENIHSGHRRRMKQQYLANGIDAFHEHQILELLLFYAMPRRDVNGLAHTLIDKFGSLYNVLNAPAVALAGFGLTENAIVLFHLVWDVHGAALKSRVHTVAFENRDLMLSYCFDTLVSYRDEKILVVCLDGSNRMIYHDILPVVSTPNSVQIQPRSFVDIAMRYNATSMVIAHNHPSGDPSPSSADKDYTEAVRDLLISVGVWLREHVIVAFPYCYEIRNNRLTQMVPEVSKSRSKKKITTDNAGDETAEMHIKALKLH